MRVSPLAGRTIAVPESRELDVFCGLLERRGARVLRCPLLAIRDAPNPDLVLGWMRHFIAGGCDDLILLTGEGLNRLVSLSDRTHPPLKTPFVRALARVRKITRGPKPARALSALGLAPDLPARIPTTAGIIETLRPIALHGRRVGLQLYGTEPNHRLVEFLQSGGASVCPVAPYVYASAADDRAVHALLEGLGHGEIEAIAFTSAAQVDRLFNAAPADTVRHALGQTLVAAVGPVAAAALADRGVPPRVVPAQSFFLKPLTTALERAFAAQP